MVLCICMLEVVQNRLDFGLDMGYILVAHLPV